MNLLFVLIIIFTCYLPEVLSKALRAMSILTLELPSHFFSIV